MQQKLNTHANVDDEILFFKCYCRTSSPRLVPFNTPMIIFFLAVTDKSENCSFIYFYLLYWSRRGISTVGRVSVISCFDGRDRWRGGRERKTEERI